MCSTEESEPAAAEAAIARRTGPGSAPSALPAPTAAAEPSSARRERGDNGEAFRPAACAEPAM